MQLDLPPGDHLNGPAIPVHTMGPIEACGEVLPVPGGRAHLWPPMDPFGHRLQLFTGKGGVGKSTVVAAMALRAAAQGHRPLVVELGHRATMESLFGVPVGYEPREVGGGVSAMNMALEDALLDYVAGQVRVRRLAGRIVSNPTLARFFRAAPAVAEVVTLHKLAQLVAAGEHHPIFVDLDATGHALMFLALPEVFEGLATAGPLRAVLERTTTLLRDHERTVLHLVTVPAPLPIQETRELYAKLKADARVRLGALIVNRVPRRPLAASEEVALDALGEEAAPDVALARRQLRRVARAARAVEELRTLGPPLLPLPELPPFEGERAPAALAQLGAILQRAMEAAP